MREVAFSKAMLAGALIFLAAAFALYVKSVDGPSPAERGVIKEIAFAEAAYDGIGAELDVFAAKAAAAESDESLAGAGEEFERNLAALVSNLRLQAQIAGVGQNANEVRTATGVNAKSTIERAEDLALNLVNQSGLLAGAGQRTAAVTNAMQKAFEESRQRQATALGGMLKENSSPQDAKRMAETLGAAWKEVGKTVSLGDDAAKKALRQAEKEEKKAAADVRMQAKNAAPGKTAKTSFGASAKVAAELAAKAQSRTAQTGAAAQTPSPPSTSPLPQASASQGATDASLKLDVVDEVLMAYRDRHMPDDGDSPSEVWNKMRWMLKMGFDSRALDCLDGYRSACLAESGEDELDDATKLITDSTEKFIREMRELDVDGGVMVASIIDKDAAEADEASGRECYRVGDIITCVGTNVCNTVDELTAHYAEGEPVKLYYLQETGALTNMVQEASGQNLEATYQFKEISK